MCRLGNGCPPLRSPSPSRPSAGHITTCLSLNTPALSPSCLGVCSLLVPAPLWHLFLQEVFLDLSAESAQFLGCFVHISLASQDNLLLESKERDLDPPFVSPSAAPASVEVFVCFLGCSCGQSWAGFIWVPFTGGLPARGGRGPALPGRRLWTVLSPERLSTQ